MRNKDGTCWSAAECSLEKLGVPSEDRCHECGVAWSKHGSYCGEPVKPIEPLGRCPLLCSSIEATLWKKLNEIAERLNGKGGG
jgi:hypothetical protein